MNDRDAATFNLKYALRPIIAEVLRNGDPMMTYREAERQAARLYAQGYRWDATIGACGAITRAR